MQLGIRVPSQTVCTELFKMGLKPTVEQVSFIDYVVYKLAYFSGETLSSIISILVTGLKMNFGTHYMQGQRNVSACICGCVRGRGEGAFPHT